MKKNRFVRKTKSQDDDDALEIAVVSTTTTTKQAPSNDDHDHDNDDNEENHHAKNNQTKQPSSSSSLFNNLSKHTSSLSNLRPPNISKPTNDNNPPPPTTRRKSSRRRTTNAPLITTNDASQTVCSLDTVKASNKKPTPPTPSSPLAPIPDSPPPPPHHHPSPILRPYYALKRRFAPPSRPPPPPPPQQPRRKKTNVLGQRRDGISILSLGPYHATLAPHALIQNTLLCPSYTDDVPQMVLEGYGERGEDRWMVGVDASRVVKLKTMGGYEGRGVGIVAADGKEGVLVWEEGRSDVAGGGGMGSCPVDVDGGGYLIDHAGHWEAVYRETVGMLENGDFDGTLEIFSKIVDSLKETHGDLHYLVGSALHNMGVVQLWDGQFDEALRSFRTASRVRFKALGGDHPSLAVSLVQLGIAFYGLGRYAEAIESFNRALKIPLPYKLSEAKILNNIACVQFTRGRYVDALSTLAQALRIQRKLLYASDEDMKLMTGTTTTTSMLVGMMMMSGGGTKRRECLGIYDASLTLNNLGRAYLEIQNWDMALVAFEEAYELQKTLFSKDHIIVVMSIANLRQTQLLKEGCAGQ